ncbi:MAG TPA: hypothetical protein VNN18_03940 [Candidatus Xenobia bacterium]|nr:hypothetical protein [Candidatus Xenobia bacterium]
MNGSGNGNGRTARATWAPPALASAGSEAALHVAWLGFVRFCQELRHGEIERLKIQDGLPVLAEVTKKKIKFGH